MLHVVKLARKRVRNAPALAWHEFACLSKRLLRPLFTWNCIRFTGRYTNRHGQTGWNTTVCCKTRRMKTNVKCAYFPYIIQLKQSRQELDVAVRKLTVWTFPWIRELVFLPSTAQKQNPLDESTSNSPITKVFQHDGVRWPPSCQMVFLKFCENLQNIYKILREKYKSINWEYIYSKKIYDMYRMAFREGDETRLPTVPIISCYTKFRIQRTRLALHQGWKWAFKCGLTLLLFMLISDDEEIMRPHNFLMYINLIQNLIHFKLYKLRVMS